MVERLYNRVQSIKKFWGHIKLKWKILAYKDKLNEQGEKRKQI